MLNTEVIFNEMFAALPGLKDYHNRDGQIYKYLEKLNAKCVADMFSSTSEQKAVSNKNGVLEFTRVLGNTTGSLWREGEPLR